VQHASDQLRRVAGQFLSGERETYATVLLGILFQVYGAECLNWDPLTLQAQITEDFGVHMPDVVNDQLMAMVAAMTSDTVYTSVHAFDQTVNAFCRVGVDHDQDMPAPEEVAWTVFELTMNDPDPYGQTSEWPFSPDIARYVGVVLADAGLKRAPETLEFAIMPEWVPKNLGDHPQEFAEAYHSAEEQSAQIDQFVQKHFQVLVSHLHEIGVEPAPPALAQAEDLPEESPLDRLLPG
jgi:hypothetical protein